MVDLAHGMLNYMERMEDLDLTCSSIGDPLHWITVEHDKNTYLVHRPLYQIRHRKTIPVDDKRRTYWFSDEEEIQR